MRQVFRLLCSSGVLCLAGLLLVACAPDSGASQAEREVRAAIERYNEILTEGYRSLDMSRMREVATSLQAEDEYIHMSSLAEGGVRLDSELQDFSVVSISVEATTALAETRETWDYRQYSVNTGDLVLEQRGLIYDLAWDLELQPDGSWLVSDVRAIDATATSEPSILGTITPGLPAGH